MKLSRRSVVASLIAGPITDWITIGKRLFHWPIEVARGQTRRLNAAPVVVHEITMTAPDIIRIEVRDGPISKGPLVGPLENADSGPYDRLLTRTDPRSGLEQTAYVVGGDKKHLKFLDRAAEHYLNRAAADDAHSYGTIGTRKVVHVYRRSEPYEYGQIVGSGGGLASATSMRHYLFLKLDADLKPGAYEVEFPPNTALGKVPFTFDDKLTRASSIRTTQVGHRPHDVSKYGYLSQWIPGLPNEGAIDFRSYGLTTFDVIDAQGRVQFTGNIADRIGPRDIEERSGWPRNIRYASQSEAPKRIAAISHEKPGIVTSQGHGFVNGDVVMLRGIAGMPQLEGHTFKVAQASADSFALQTEKGEDVDTRGFGAFDPNAYLPGFSGLIYATYLANRAATYVYGLDYSAWRPDEPGLYRIRIPGLGVSDTFRIDEAIWYAVARNAASGEYHQRNGIALDGRFGYTRGVSFRDGVNGTKIYWSRLPALFSSEWTTIGHPVPSKDGANPSTWLTATRAVGWYGGSMDAGDWDDSTYNHGLAYYWLLDLGYENLPPAARHIEFGLPKSTEVLDPALYAGTDPLPDPVHQAIWYFDAYRRLQRSDGAVGAGLGFDGGGHGRRFEASSISRAQAFIYAPDPASNFTYALGAAKLAVILKGAGFARLANVWTESAVKAWDWAEGIYQSGLADGTARDAYFLGELNIKANAGWSDIQYREALSVLDRLTPPRRSAAAGALFRLTGDDIYRALIEKRIVSPIAGDPGIDQWEYVQSPAANPALRRRILQASGGFERDARNSVQPYMLGRIGYKNLGKAQIPWIANGGPVTEVLQAYIRTRAPEFLGLLQDGLAVTLGANQTGFCYTNGIGHRTFARSTLHVDANCLGLAKAPNGITHFGWDQPGIMLRFFNFSTDAPINFTAETPTGRYQADFGTSKVYTPYRLSMPFAEQTVSNPFIIFHMEYQLQKTIIPQEIAAIWLHAWDGNTSTRFSSQ
jgi:endoglucanase